MKGRGCLEHLSQVLLYAYTLTLC